MFQRHQLGSLILKGDLVDAELGHGCFVLAHDFIQLHFQIVHLRRKREKDEIN